MNKNHLGSERAARRVLDALPAAIYTTDAAGRITYCNKAARELAGREIRLGEDMWCVTHRLFHADGTPLPHDQCPMAVALKEDRPVRGVEAIAERPDGSRFPILPYPTPLRDEAGNLVGGVNMLVDITEKKRAEELQRSLVGELNHRVGNVLAIVQAMAAQSIRNDGIPLDMRKTFEGRLVALGRMHYHISLTRWGPVDLHAVAGDMLTPFSTEQSERIEFLGRAAKLPPQQMLTLGLVLYELATNAARFGALSGPDGHVTLSWSLRRDGPATGLVLSWHEEGGPAVDEPRYRGFGCRFIERSLAEMGGSATLLFNPDGLLCDIELPVPDCDEEAGSRWLDLHRPAFADQTQTGCQAAFPV